jgi:hypothetical protein
MLGLLDFICYLLFLSESKKDSQPVFHLLNRTGGDAASQPLQALPGDRANILALYETLECETAFGRSHLDVPTDFPRGAREGSDDDEIGWTLIEDILGEN